jgi:hypothetical protein
MTTQSATRTHTPGVIRSRGLTLVVAALGFVGFYLSTEVALGSLASTSLPLPTDPVAHARDWFASNQQAAVVMGLLQVLSVACLATFVWALHDSMSTTAQRTATARARPWGWLAVGLMVASSALAWLMAALAPTSSLDTVAVLRTANFIAGGTGHVLALGVFAVLAGRVPGMTRPLRVLGYVAAVPAVLSLLSLVVWQAAAFILLGRLVCMVWTISAAISLTRQGRRNPR